MMTNGIGPKPKAKDLDASGLAFIRQSAENTHMTNVRIEILEMVDLPEFKPYPRNTKEINCPMVEMSNNLRLPNF